ncbi:MAG: hypothetical protein H7240_07150 [Glaciimonas sp.]|nr:hypothetical protein [Glaciimonas sp.]
MIAKLKNGSEKNLCQRLNVSKFESNFTFKNIDHFYKTLGHEGEMLEFTAHLSQIFDVIKLYLKSKLEKDPSKESALPMGFATQGENTGDVWILKASLSTLGNVDAKVFYFK